MIKDAEMRSKAKLIDGFIQKNVDEDKENFMVQRKKRMALAIWKND